MSEWPPVGTHPWTGQARPAGELRDCAAVPGIAALFRSHHAALVQLAMLLVRDQATAEDVVQDVFTRLHSRGGAVGDRGDPESYIRAAVLNRCRSVLRRRALAQRLAGIVGRPSDMVRSAEHEAILAEDRREVLAALGSLPARRREVLVLRYYLGMSEAEIAAVMGIRPGTVKSTAARGLAALARALGEDS